jgi:DNA-nicking Smr family endonuclease
VRDATPADAGPFAVTRAGERVEGLARGVDAAHLRRLRRGEVEIGRDLDLHGLDARAARLEVAAAVRAAYQAGERCLRIVHGRGLHSPGAPVLKDAVLERLAQPPLASLVLAFSSAPPREGGAGALLVLLRRRRG